MVTVAKAGISLVLDACERALADWIRARRAEQNPPRPVTLDEEGYLGEPYEREVRKMH